MIRRIRESFRSQRDRGYSMVEIVAVVGIAGAIAAISIPAVANQRVSAEEATLRTNLTSASAAVEANLIIWRGAPVEPLHICFDPVEAIGFIVDDPYPSVAPLDTTCDPGTWEALLEDGSAPDPVLEGFVSEGVTLMGYVAIDGSYCLDAASSDASASPYYLASQIGEPMPGTCMDPADGSDPWRRSTTPPTYDLSTDPYTPEAPYDLTVQVVDRVATLSWTATTGVYYYAQISNNSGKTSLSATSGMTTCIFPGDSCAGPGGTGAQLAPGTYEALVRAGNDNGWGPPATVKFHVTNGNG